MAVEKVTVKEALQRASFRYREAGLEQPREEAEILLAHLLGWDRLRLYLEGERELPPEAAAAFQEAQERRSRGEPLAYITGKKEFYGLEFKVTPAVLIPRPETEFLVDAVLEWVGKRGAPRGEGLVLGDLGTGSGWWSPCPACFPWPGAGPSISPPRPCRWPGKMPPGTRWSIASAGAGGITLRPWKRISRPPALT